MPKFNVYESCDQTNQLEKYSVCAPSLRAAQVVATKRQKFSKQNSYIRIRDEQDKSLASKAYGRWFHGKS